MASKPHWTQTPAGKKKLAARARAMHKTGAFKKGAVGVHSKHEQGGQASSLEAHVAYLAGKCETIIEYYARGQNIPVEPLAAGVAGLLRHSAGG